MNVYHWAPSTQAACGRRRLPRHGAEHVRLVRPSPDGDVHLRAIAPGHTTCSVCREYVQAEFHREMYIPSNGGLLLAPGAAGVLSFGPLQRELRAMRRVFVDVCHAVSGATLAGGETLGFKVHSLKPGAVWTLGVKNEFDVDVSVRAFAVAIADEFFL